MKHFCAAALVLMSVLIGNCNGALPTLKQLEEILNERQDRVFSVDCEFSTWSDVQYPLDAFSRNNLMLLRTKARVAVEQGKFFASTEYLDVVVGSSESQVFRESWNGDERYGSLLHADGSGRNSIYHSFKWGANTRVMGSILEKLDIETGAVLGSRNGASGRETGKINTPFRVLNRLKVTGGEGEERVELQEVTHNGKPCILLTLINDFDSTRDVEHIIDPDLDFACVESKFYHGSNDLQYTVVRNYEKNDDGSVELKSSETIETVAHLAFIAEEIEALDSKYTRGIKYKGIKDAYKKEDYGKTAIVKHVEINKLKINLPVDPSVYEQGNVFVLGAEIWDEDRGIQVQPSLDEITRNTLLAIGKGDNSVPKATEQESESAETEVSEDLTAANSLPENAGDEKSAPEQEVADSQVWWVALLAALALVIAWFVRKKKSACTFLILAMLLLPVTRHMAAQERKPEEKEVINLGVIGFGEDSTSFRYEFTNDYENPLHVEKVKPSCSCVAGDYPEVINPGETEAFEFVYNSEGRVGPVKAIIAISFKEMEEPFSLMLKGYKQDASLTKDVMFCDLIKREQPEENNQSLHRVITLRLFDKSDPNCLSLANFEYDASRLIIIPSIFRENDFSVTVEGQKWTYAERAFQVLVKPEGIDIGPFNEKIFFRYPPFDKQPAEADGNSKDSTVLSSEKNGTACVDSNSLSGADVTKGTDEAHRFELVVNAMGRVVGDVYVKPASLMFLLNKQTDNKSVTKRFTLFNEQSKAYELEYDEGMFRLEQEGNQFQLGLVTDRLKDILSATGKIPASPIVFRYGSAGESYVLPVSIIVY